MSNMMLQSEKIGEISKALSSFQGECPVLEFDGSAKLKGMSKAGKAYEYGYKYLTLPKLRSGTKELVASNGLALLQATTFTEGQFFLVTTISHDSGQWFRGYYPLIADMKDPQKLGSVMSYAKRYAMAAILGVVADEDDDGSYGNLRREERQAAADEKQMEIEKKLKERKDIDATNRVMAIELVLENCSTLEELGEAWAGKCSNDVVWLRANAHVAFKDLIIKKDELKDKLNG